MLYFVHKEEKEHQANFIIYISTITIIRDIIQTTKNERKYERRKNDNTILLPFLRFFLSSERNKKNTKS